MKTFQLKSQVRGRQGKTILIALLIVAFVTPMLMSTLKMASVQRRTVSVSQNWNSSIPVVEAGIEEAMAHLNNNCHVTVANNGVLNWTGGSWHSDPSGNGIYCDRRYFPDGSYYDVRIITNGAGIDPEHPQIVCVGGSPALIGLADSRPQFAFINRGTNTVMTRQVRVDAAIFSWFGWGMIADGDINWSGQGLMDSFDSASADHSYFGAYNPDWNNDNSLIGSLGGNIDLGPNSVVYGSAATGATGNLSGGTVGDEAWIDGGNTGVQSGHYSQDLNEDMDEVELPDVSGWPSLTSCSGPNCTTTITNQVKTNTWITSSTYPASTPPGNVVITNITTNTPVTTATYPSPVPAGGVKTNYDVQVSFTYPTNLAAGTLIFTNTGWFTNTAPNEVSLPVYPTGASSITQILRGETNDLNSPPPYGVYVGTLTNKGAGATKLQNGNPKIFSTNWAYAHIHAYRYATNTYSWTNLTYTYTNNVNVTYTYMGPRIDPEVISDSYEYKTPATGGKHVIHGSVSLTGSQKFLIRGTNTIYVTGDFKITGNDAALVLEEGAKVTFYFGGEVDIGGNGVANYNDTADKLLMYGLPTCTDFKVHGNGAFIGAIYAPNAEFTAGGGGSSGMMIGSIAAKTIAMNGHPHLAYDENLARVLPSAGYRVSEWKEEDVGTTP